MGCFSFLNSALLLISQSEFASFFTEFSVRVQQRIAVTENTDRKIEQQLDDQIQLGLKEN